MALAAEKHLEIIRNLKPTDQMPVATAKAVNRIVHTPEVVWSDTERELVKLYNIRMMESSTYFKQTTESFQTKRETSAGDVHISEIESLGGVLKRTISENSVVVKTVFTAYDKHIEGLQATIKEQREYIKDLQAGRVALEKERRKTWRDETGYMEEIRKHRKMILKMEEALKNKGEDEEGFLEQMTEENFSKLGNLLELIGKINKKD